MDTITYCVFLILLAITTLAFLKYNIFVYEKFEPPITPTCTISSSGMTEIWESHRKIKTIMTNLKELPWPNTNSFMILYTVLVTRMEYLLNTYGNKISSHHFAPMLSMDSVAAVIDYYLENHAGLLQEVFAEVDKIHDIIGHTVELACPVCDSVYIRTNLQYIDHEFALYMSNIFPKNLAEIDEPTKQKLAQIEADMLNLTEIITTSIANQKLDAKGKLDSTIIDIIMKDLQVNFLLISANLNLRKFLNDNVDDIGTFIELKKLIIEDLKQCILTPIVYDKCHFTGKKANLIEGSYKMSELYAHYQMSNVASIQIPSNYYAVIHMNDGVVTVNDIDLPCMKENNIDVITISLKKKTT
jgi:hypothetical protein